MPTDRRWAAPLVALALVALVTAACADGAASTAPADESMEADESMHADASMPADDGHTGEMHFGVAADPAAADRVIEIVGTDDFTWTPANIEIAVGETVTLRVTNDGVIPHDFLLGDEHMQEAHAEEMADGHGDMHDAANAFLLDPGETKEMTWTFTDAGQLLYGCHQAGHYEAGMVGSVTVS